MRAIAAFSLLILVVGCQTAPPPGLTAADQEAIYELGLRYQAAARAGDWAAWTDLWTTDAVYQIPEAPALVGHEQIMANAQAFPVPTEMNVTIDDSDGSGKWAWVRGTWNFTAAATEEMPELRMFGSFLWVLEKQADGTWLIDTECYNLDEPSDIPVEG
jgi:ketosteroid isomerase-like protein